MQHYHWLKLFGLALCAEYKWRYEKKTYFRKRN